MGRTTKSPIKKSVKKATGGKKRSLKKKSSNSGVYKICGLALIGAVFYLFLIKSSVNIESDYCYFYIPKNSSAASVYDSLKSKNLLKSNFNFWIMQKVLKYNKASEGLYRLKSSWSTFTLIRNLKAGGDTRWTLYEIPSYRSREQTIKKICKQLDFNRKDFTALLKDEEYLSKQFGLTTESIYCLFIPGEYMIYKGRTIEEFLSDLHGEYSKFWNEERRAKAKDIDCSPEDIIKLASIVYAETKNVGEMPLIAGTYLNRLKKNMLLQADPTLLFANNKRGTKRIYFKLTASNSPYNTYKFKGLPPGPIGPAPKEAIEAVLNYAEHDYLYFCAKDDASGCHSFAVNYEDHRENARKYQNMLNRKKIR
jgi:UPF0755 protein